MQDKLRDIEAYKIPSISFVSMASWNLHKNTRRFCSYHLQHKNIIITKNMKTFRNSPLVTINPASSIIKYKSNISNSSSFVTYHSHQLNLNRNQNQRSIKKKKNLLLKLGSKKPTLFTSTPSITNSDFSFPDMYASFICFTVSGSKAWTSRFCKRITKNLLSFIYLLINCRK